MSDAAQAGAAVLDAGQLVAPEVRFRLGVALLERFQARGQGADLAGSTNQLRAAASALPPGDPDRGLCLTELGTALEFHCDRGAPIELVGEYVAVARELLADRAEDDPEYALALIRLADALRYWFIRTGAAEDIDESVRHGRAALAMLS